MRFTETRTHVYNRKTLQLLVPWSTFSQKLELRCHIMNHTGKKLHVCDFCLKSFPVISRLQQLMRSHTKEKPYKCDACGNVFFHEQLLV